MFGRSPFALPLVRSHEVGRAVFVSTSQPKWGVTDKQESKFINRPENFRSPGGPWPAPRATSSHNPGPCAERGKLSRRRRIPAPSPTREALKVPTFLVRQNRCARGPVAVRGRPAIPWNPRSPVMRPAGSPQAGSRPCSAHEEVVHSDCEGVAAIGPAVDPKPYESSRESRTIRVQLSNGLARGQIHHPK